MSRMSLETSVVSHRQIQISEDLMRRFFGHVNTSPQSIAILTTDGQWTYEMLYHEVLKWKVILSQYVGRRAIVSLDRSPRLVAILMALQLLRVAYIPVDPKTPHKRLLAIVEDSQAETLLHDDSLLFHDFPCLVFNVEHVDARHTHCRDQIDIPEASDTLAYIIYTSGSTGTPKGVAISWQALNHFLLEMAHVFLREPQAMLLAATTVAFDIAQLELWLPIWQGATLFLANQAQHRDPNVLCELLEKYPITLFQSTPSFWSMLHIAGWKGSSRLVALCGGEALSDGLAVYLLGRVAELWNMYGPTEATVWCAMKRIKKDEPITIGRPIHGMTFYILSPSLEPLPPGVKGELYIAGISLSEGYINQEELNKNAFIQWQDSRLYRVGDLALQTLQGEFVILGRTDHQVKLRGYRIELEEIESCLKNYDAVRNAAVVIHEDQLIAYLSVDDKTHDEHLLIQHLKSHLPEYMLPHQLIYLETFPLSLSGKIDRKSLPKPNLLPKSKTTLCTKMEASLCQIWQEIFQCAITPEDNFFALGGHSLIAARISAEIASKLGKSIPLDMLYRAPTVRLLARTVEEALLSERVKDVSRPPLGAWFALTDYQAMFWLSQRFESGLKVFNIVARRRLQGALDSELLDKALAFVFQKHPVLSYEFNRFYPAQRLTLKSPVRWKKRVLDQDDAFEKVLNDSYDNLFYRHQWSPNAPMILAKLFLLPNNQTELQICLSHLIADERSLDVFFEDLWAGYMSYSRSNRAPIQKNIPQFDEHAVKHHQALTLHASEKMVFWERYLADTGYFPIPEQYIVSKMKNDAQNYITYTDIPLDLLPLMQDFCAEHQLTLSEVLIAAVGLALQSCVPEKSPRNILVNLVKSARRHRDPDKSMGCFLDMAVIKLKLNITSSLLELARLVQQSWIETLDYQETANLTKYASIGRFQTGMGKVKHAFVRGFLSFYSKCIPIGLRNEPLFQASAKIAQHSRKKDFFVSVNVLNSFIAVPSYSNEMQEAPMSEHPFPAMPITSVLDIWFFREYGIDQPKLLIASNLKSEFREKLATTFIQTLKNAFFR